MFIGIFLIFFYFNLSFSEKLKDDFLFLNEPNFKSKSLNQENDTELTSNNQLKIKIVNSKHFYSSKFNESFDFEKYFHLDYNNFENFCIEKKKFKNLNLYQADKNRYVLIIDDNRLSFEFSFSKNYIPLIKKIPYKCTSYCEAKFKNQETNLSIRRIKMQSYLIEFLTKKHSTLITFYLENIDNLNKENNLVPALSFVVKNEECAMKVVSPSLDKYAVDNLLIQDLYKLFCHSQIRPLILRNIPFIIKDSTDSYSDFEDQLKEIFLDKNYVKDSKIIFFNKSDAVAFKLNSNPELDPRINFKNIKLEYNFVAENGLILIRDVFNKEELFLSLDNDNFYLSYLEDNTFKLYNNHASLKTNTFFGCPQSFCHDSQIDAMFTIPNCYLELLPQFKPKAKKILVVFQKEFMYYIDLNNKKVPSYEDGIPIDYLFHEILKREDINFSYLDAAEYIEESKIIIMFKNDEYLLIDPENLIVNGPFKIYTTFTSGPASNINSVYFDNGHLILVKDNFFVKYKWFAKDLSEKKKIDLENFISFNSPKKEFKINLKIDAILKHKDNNYYFTDQSFFIFNNNIMSRQSYQDISTKFFYNCSKVKARLTEAVKEQHLYLAHVLEGFSTEPVGREFNYSDIKIVNENDLFPSKSSSFKINLNFFILILLIFRIMF